jgi:exopolyphosphatase / guanosine-5'-triphosphate,3'-diphosphate pyrophosphatase
MAYSPRKAMGRILASADIGSNTVHLLVAGVNGRGVVRLANLSEWLSLGEIVERDGTVPKAVADRLVRTLREYRETARTHKAEGLYVFATEAMRRAEGHDDLLARIKAEAGLQVHLISPRREAELGLRGALLDCQGPDPVLFVECGGGSVQIARASGGCVQDEASLAIGTGVLVSRAGLTQPATDEQLTRLDRSIDHELERIASFGATRRAVACGGVARGLWRALHPDGDRHLHIEELRFLAWDTRRLTVQQVCGRYGVKEKRAATLLPGARVFARILEATGHHEVTVSEFGVREGALLEVLDGRAQPCPL